jgi:hypothetical protein
MNIILSNEAFDVLWAVVLGEIQASEAVHRNAVGSSMESSTRYWLDQLLAVKAAMDRNQGGGE